MKCASHYKRQLKTHLKDYLHHPQVRKMQDFTQHGQTSTFAHVYHVTAMSLYINERFNLQAHEEHLATG
ncbi:MAG: hypothetical protein IJV62_02265, partial [Eggerthellaceae bacterium]|nr:hypothetical protein [Eggerthellaceae bacterium]